MSQTGAKVRVSADLTVTKRPHVTDGNPCWCDPGRIHAAGVNVPEVATRNGAAKVTESDE